MVGRGLSNTGRQAAYFLAFMRQGELSYCKSYCINATLDRQDQEQQTAPATTLDARCLASLYCRQKS